MHNTTHNPDGILSAHESVGATSREDLPVAIIGAGPVGLAAAAHVLQRGLRPLVLERGPDVGHAMRAWGHVQVFSPWRYCLDAAAVALLEGTDWRAPKPDGLPTGEALVRDYLEPLARHPALRPHVVLDAHVHSIGRLGYDKLRSAGRDAAPFLLRWRDGAGRAGQALARAVLDASGTWFAPNPLGVDGQPVAGEAGLDARIRYGVPDVAGALRGDYAGRRVLVVGAGHSAMNVVLDLCTLRASAPGTEVLWALRRDSVQKLAGGGLADQLPARGALGLAAQQAVTRGRVTVLAPYAAERIEPTTEGLRVSGRLAGAAHTLEVERIVVATGFRPELSLFRELRVALDPALEAPPALAPLIDPNVHSCGTVPPHGVVELTQPEPGFYIVGAKSYGRAPTFLMATGYEQVRSIAAELAGDAVAAREVHLVLPETGVCGVPAAGAGAAPGAGSAPGAESEAAGCCGGPAPRGVHACCVKDAEAKSAGEAGCGCSAPAAAEAPPEKAAAQVVDVAPRSPRAGGCCGGAA